MDVPQRLQEPVAPVPRQREAVVAVAVYPTCPGCARPVELTAHVVGLADGRNAIDADALRLALRIHMRRCAG